MCMIHVLHYWLLVYVMDGHWAQLWTDKVGLVGQITVRKYKLLVTFTGWIPKTFPGVISMLSQLHDVYRGGATKFGFISITYHKYIFGVYKYILRLQISTFDRENR